MLAYRIIAWSLAFALAFFPALAGAQSPLRAFPPGTFQSRAAIDAPVGKPMVTPIILGTNTNPSATAINYASIVGGTWTSFAGTKDNRAPIAGSFSNLTVLLPTSVLVGQYVFTLYVNDVATALACTITSGNTCSNASVVSYNQGDLLAWQSCPGTHTGVAGTCTPGTPTVQVGSIALGATLTGTVNGESAIFSGANGAAPSTSVANYMFFGSADGSTPWNATEANISGIMPTGGTIDRLYVQLASAPGAAKTYVWTVYKNGSPTSLTCTTTGTGSANQTCNDTNAAHAVTVVATDTISLQASPTGTPASNFLTASLRWVPTNPGEAVAMNAGATALSTTSNQFLPAAGSGVSTTEILQIFSIIPTALTLKNLYALVDTIPGAGTPSRTWINRFGTGSGQSSGTITCVMTTSASCNDTTHTYSASVNNLINLQETPSGTPAATTRYKTSVVMATP